LTAQI
jgi:uncharacterized protein (TIGR02271 family)